MTKYTKYLLAAVGLLLASTAGAFVDSPWTPIGPPGATAYELERDPDDPAIMYIGTNFGGLYKSIDYGLTWSHLDSPFSESTILSLAIDPVNTSHLVVSVFGGKVYRSVDQGITWTDISSGLSGENVAAVAIHPTNGSTVLAATTSALYSSSTGGGDWTATSIGLAAGANDLLFDPRLVGVVYAGTPAEGVRISIDSGATWGPYSSGLGSTEVLQLVHGSIDDVVIAVSSTGIFIRDKDASAWTELTFNLPQAPITDVAQHPGTGRLFVTVTGQSIGALSGVFESDASATSMTTWTQWDPTPSRRISFDPNGFITHVARAIGVIEATIDDGATFFPAQDGLQNVFSGAFTAISLGVSSVQWTSTDLGVFGTSDPESPQPFWFIGDLDEKPFSLVADPEQPGEIYSGGENGTGVSRSDDWGITWTRWSDGLVPNEILDITQSPVGDKTLYAGTSSGLFVSDDDGVTWRKGTSSATPIRVTAVAADPSAPGIAYFGAGNGEVFMTLDGAQNVFLGSTQGLPSSAEIVHLRVVPWGNIFALTGPGVPYTTDPTRTTWTPINDGLAHPAAALEYDPGAPWRVFVGTLGGGIYRSASGGIAWEQSNTGLGSTLVFSLAIKPGDTQTLLAGTEDGIYRSTNGGDTWTVSGSGLARGVVYRLVYDPDSPGNVYATVFDEGAFKSTDGGSTWSPMAVGEPFTRRMALALGTQAADAIFLGSHLSGVYASTDGGATFSPGSTGISLLVRGLALDPGDSDRMYAGSLANGLFKSANGGFTWEYSGLSQLTHFDIAVDPFDTLRVYSAGVGRSLDGGGPGRC